MTQCERTCKQLTDAEYLKVKEGIEQWHNMDEK